jgi:hemoglobin/transferrin/lactoferrin receptor protein
MSHPPRGASAFARANFLPIHFLGISAVALACALPQAALAQDLTESQATILERFVLTATRASKNVLDVPKNVAVIDAETLEKHQVRDIQDLVRYEPGIAVTRTTSITNPGGQLNSFTIRGVSGNRVQMLVDGSRVQESVIDGSRDFVDPWNMQAVELLRGPNSVLWGADALGGTVAFRTKEPSDLLEGSDKPWAVEIKTSYDSFDHTFRKQVTGAYDFGDFAVLGSIGNMTATEPELSNADPDGGIWQCPRPSYFRCDELFPSEINEYNGLLKGVWTPNADHKVTALWEFNDSNTAIDQIWDSSANTGTGNSYYVSEDYQREIDMDRQHFALDHEWQVNAPWLDSLKWTLSYAPQSRDFHSEQLRNYTQATTNPGYRTLITDRNYSEEFLEADIQAVSSFDLGPTHHTLTYGFDGDTTASKYLGQTVTDYADPLVTDTTAVNQGFAFPDTQTNRADIYIQDEIELFDGKLTVTPGLRYATYNLEPGTPITSVPLETIGSERLIKALSATYKIDDSYSVYASYGEGFKMPTAQQLFYTSSSSTFQIIPNPDLLPESVASYEAGLRGEFEHGYFSVGAYYAQYENYIQTLQFVTDTPIATYTSLNVDSVKTWGIEASAEWEAVENVFLTGSLTWSDGVQQKTDADPETVFDGAIPLTAVLGVRYELPENNLEFEFFGTFAQGVTERSDPNAFKPEGYAVFDAYAKYKPTENVELTAGIQNIFDTRYFPNTLTGYATTATDSVAGQNPLELQVAPGRTFKVGASVKF